MGLDKRRPPRSARCWILGILLTGCLVFMVLRFAALRSMAVLSLLAAIEAYPELSGLPSHCGSDARSTWIWMNPARFNASYQKKKKKKTLKKKSHKRRQGASHGLFLVGCGHSGTTPVAALLARHPHIWMYAPNEALEYSVKPNSFSDVGRFLRQRKNIKKKAAAKKSVFALLPRALVPSRRDDVKFSRLATARKPNATHWLVKSPSNVCRLGYILHSLPKKSRILALVRDGRDVMLSLLERYPKADPGGPLCLNRWVKDNKALLLFAADPRLHLVRYEDLFDRPNKGYPVLRQALRALGVDPKHLPAMLYAQSHDASLVGQPTTVANIKYAANAHQTRALPQYEQQQRITQSQDTRALPSSFSTTNIIPYPIPNHDPYVTHSTTPSFSGKTQPHHHHHHHSSWRPPMLRGAVHIPKAVVASEAHTQLRSNQTHRPFVRARPRWPSEMTPALKRIFKANHDALALLTHFGYANSSHSW